MTAERLEKSEQLVDASLVKPVERFQRLDDLQEKS